MWRETKHIGKSIYLNFIEEYDKIVEKSNAHESFMNSNKYFKNKHDVFSIQVSEKNYTTTSNATLHMY